MSVGIYDGIHFGDGDSPLAEDNHPDYWFRRSEEATPLQKLCQRLLLSAMEELSHKDKRIRDAARWWLQNGRARIPCDFVCEVLGIRYKPVADYVEAAAQEEDEAPAESVADYVEAAAQEEDEAPAEPGGLRIGQAVYQVLIESPVPLDLAAIRAVLRSRSYSNSDNSIRMRLLYLIRGDTVRRVGRGLYESIRTAWPITEFRGPYRFLSNFLLHEMTTDVGWGPMTYASVEHAFQAAKAVWREHHDLVRSQPTPGKAKRAGRDVLLREGWDSDRERVMSYLLREKFKGSALRDSLLKTEDAPLVEGNTWHDNYWGNCVCPRCHRITGQNNLGEALMVIRQELVEAKGME